MFDRLFTWQTPFSLQASLDFLGVPGLQDEQDFFGRARPPGAPSVRTAHTHRSTVGPPGGRSLPFEMHAMVCCRTDGGKGVAGFVGVGAVRRHSAVGVFLTGFLESGSRNIMRV